MRLPNFILSLVFLFASFFEGKTQANQKPAKFFIAPGFGLTGNFFVKNYNEHAPTPVNYSRTFVKKKFIGTGQEIAVGLHLKKNTSILLGYRCDRFGRHVVANDTIRTVNVVFDHKIYHINNIWFGGFMKSYTQKKSGLSLGAGAFYLRPRQQNIELYPGYVINREYNQKTSRSNEGGFYAAVAYAYKFQPKVNLGVKTQAFYTASAAYFESISLFPYIELNF